MKDISTVQDARAEWERVHEAGEHPSNMEEIYLPKDRLKDGKIWVVKLIDYLHFQNGRGEYLSRSDIRRLIRQRGIKIDGCIIECEKSDIEFKPGMVISISKKQFKRCLMEENI